MPEIIKHKLHIYPHHMKLPELEAFVLQFVEAYNSLVQDLQYSFPSETYLETTNGRPTQSFHVVNAYKDNGAVWRPIDMAYPAWSLSCDTVTSTFCIYYCAAGINPVVWGAALTVDASSGLALPGTITVDHIILTTLTPTQIAYVSATNELVGSSYMTFDAATPMFTTYAIQLTGMSSAGIVKNDASGYLSGGNLITTTNIDWGTGPGQVSATNIPIADTGGYFGTDTVEAALQDVGALLGGFWFLEITSGVTMAPCTRYLVNNVSRVSLTLPATAAVGDVYSVVGKGAGGWRICQNAGQTIHCGMKSTVTGTTGYVESSHYLDNLELLCITANTDFKTIGPIGNWDINIS